MSKKVLFVVDTLAQHGAERYLYEIIKILLKHGFVVSVYSIEELVGDSAYYVSHMQDMGVDVYVKNKLPHPDIKNAIMKKIANSFSYRITRRIKATYIDEKIAESFLNRLLDYDFVSIIKWEVYVKGRNTFDKIPHKKIHIMSAIEQYVDYPYSKLPIGRTDFVLMYPEQEKEVLNDRDKTKDINTYTVPLLIDNDSWTNSYNPKKDGILRIGIFSRIHHDQPTIFILAIIHELKVRKIPVELYFFGRYYDESFYKHYIKTAEILKISDEVKFMGHTESLMSAIRDNHLDVGVMNNFSSFIGYSSIEVQSHGLPVVFFNVANSGYSSDFPIIRNTVPEICDIMQSFWKDKSKLKELSDKTFAFSKEKYSIKNNTNKVLAVYQS